MGLLNSALHIGRTALLSYQGALQVVGNNISSAGSPDYTRLTPRLDPVNGLALSRGLQPGAGVELTAIQRNVDEALEDRLRRSIGGQQSADARSAMLTQLETQFDDVTGNGIAARLRSFFNTFDEVQNSPEDIAVRELAVASAASLAGAIQTQRTRLVDLGVSTDQQIAPLVERANGLIGQLRDLNERITREEAGGPARATGLRDQRDGVLRQLGELFELTVYEQPNGALNVYIGSEALVQGGFSRGLTAVETVDGEFRRTIVRFEDTQGQVPPPGGRIGGLIAGRDQEAYGRVALLDRFARAVIEDVNRVHADGQGLIGMKSVTGARDLLATDVPLNAANALGTEVRQGSFYIVVSDDASRTPVAHRVAVTLDGATGLTTLESLAASMNDNVTGVSAEVTSDRRLRLTADPGVSFTFGHDGAEDRADTSGVLAALGINTLFTGSDARNMAIHPALAAEPRFLAAATHALPGDGSNAGRIASLDTAESTRLGGSSLVGFFNQIVSSVSISAGEAKDDSDATSAITASLRAQRESVSGVSLDEEAVALIKYERAFQGVSRYVSVVDNLIGELVSLIR